MGSVKIHPSIVFAKLFVGYFGSGLVLLQEKSHVDLLHNHHRLTGLAINDVCFEHTKHWV